MADIGLDAILATLLGVQKDAEANSPFVPITDATDLIGKTLIQSSPNYSIGENILAGLLTGAVDGLAQRGTKNYANEQTNLASDYLLNSGNILEKPKGLDESIFQKLKPTLSIFEKSENRENTRTVFDALARANTPLERRSIIDAAQKLGLIPEDAFGQQVSEASPPTTIARQQSTNLFPGTSINDRRIGLIKEGLNLGLPGGAAQKEAADQMAAFSAANKESVDTVAAARTRAKLLSELSSTAEAAVKSAGETGGALRLPREALSSLYATIDTEEANQRANQSLLDSISPEIIKMSRTPGSVSDFESKLFLGAGPSSRQTPEANVLLIEKMKTLAALENDYANFLEAYRAEKGTTSATMDAPGAEQLWHEYTKVNPPFVYAPDGSMVYNQKRTPWQQWLQNPTTAPAEPPGAQAETSAIPAGAQPTGRTYKGQRVYIVDGKLWVPNAVY